MALKYAEDKGHAYNYSCEIKDGLKYGLTCANRLLKDLLISLPASVL